MKRQQTHRPPPSERPWTHHEHTLIFTISFILLTSRTSCKRSHEKFTYLCFNTKIRLNVLSGFNASLHTLSHFKILCVCVCDIKPKLTIVNKDHLKHDRSVLPCSSEPSCVLKPPTGGGAGAGGVKGERGQSVLSRERRRYAIYFTVVTLIAVCSCAVAPSHNLHSRHYDSIVFSDDGESTRVSADQLPTGQSGAEGWSSLPLHAAR